MAADGRAAGEGAARVGECCRRAAAAAALVVAAALSECAL